MHANISFGSVPAEKRHQLGQNCITRLIASDSAEGLADLFWRSRAMRNQHFALSLQLPRRLMNEASRNIATLIERAIPRLAFSSPGFARDLIGQFSGEQRERIVEAFASQARHLGSGVFTEIQTTTWPSGKNNLQIRWLLFRTKLVLRSSRGHFAGSRSRKQQHSRLILARSCVTYFPKLKKWKRRPRSTRTNFPIGHTASPSHFWVLTDLQSHARVITEFQQ